jgi:hypothetical protein
MEMDYRDTNTAMGQSNGDETLLVKFFNTPLKNEVKTLEAGRPIFEETEFISIMAPGSRNNVERPVRDVDKTRFPRHYAAFKAREDQESVDGTVLSEWPGITRGQAEELRFFNVVTVEQLAGVADNKISNFMGLQTLKTKAREYLEASKGNAAVEALIAANNQIEALKERLDALESGRDRPKKRRKRRTPAQMEAAKQVLEPQE